MVAVAVGGGAERRHADREKREAHPLASGHLQLEESLGEQSHQNDPARYHRLPE